MLHERRWAILAVVALALAVFVRLMDGTIVNVALPSLATDLGASTRQLQWIAAGSLFASRFLPARALPAASQNAGGSVAGALVEVGVDVEDRRQEVVVGEQR